MYQHLACNGIRGKALYAIMTIESERQSCKNRRKLEFLIFFNGTVTNYISQMDVSIYSNIFEFFLLKFLFFWLFCSSHFRIFHLFIALNGDTGKVIKGSRD